MSQPLEGIRVVDLGDWIAGPLTSVLLGDLGAEVIRIDRPGASNATPTRSCSAASGGSRSI